MDVFIVATPTQLVNAIEAKHTFPGEKCVLIVLARAFPAQKFSLLIQPGDWDDIHFIAIPKLAEDAEFFVPKGRWQSYSYDIRRKLQIDRLTRRLKPIRRLYLGFYEDGLMRHCSNSFKYEELWLLDDGTGTLQINKRRKGEEIDTTTSQRTNWKTILVERFMGYRKSDVSQLTFFTAYILEPRPGDHAFHHKYEFLRRASDQAQQLDEVFLLGGPLIERRRMLEEKYLEYIRKAQAYFKNENLVYIPHKREEMQLLRNLETNLGLVIRRIEVPIEYYISLGGMKPKAIASFYSSALENCRLILNENIPIKAFYLRPEDLISGHKSIETIYEYYRGLSGQNFEVVKLS